MSLVRSPIKRIDIQDSTNIYLKNLDTLSFLRRLNEIKGRSAKNFENKPLLRKNVISFEANSNI